MVKYATLQEAQAAVREGKAVYWKTKAYRVSLHTFHNGTEQWLVCCTFNNHCTGLFHEHGYDVNRVHSDYKPEDFFSE